MVVSSRRDAVWFAPCGMNCSICYKHLGQNPCGGCRTEGEHQPNHCHSCSIKACVEDRGAKYCFACTEFPCRRIKGLDQSYRTRYGVSLIECSRSAKKHGVEAFLQEQMGRYTCADCGGVISLHDGNCSECGKQYPRGRRSVEP